jgi:alkyldihydroxyacetonephosphate synthase
VPLDDLTALLDAEAVSTDPADLAAHARDWWPLAMLRERRGDALTQPVAVVWPSGASDVSRVLSWAGATRTPVVPFGAGSGVHGGAQAVEGAITLDLRRLDPIEIDDEALTVTAGAGVMGPALEGALNARGLTLGHFPQSIDISTVGGWLACRGAGQKSSRYGRIEEMLLGLEVVLPNGTVVQTKAAPASSAGPDLARLFLGSEGTLGVITSATLKIHPSPSRVAHGAYGFGSFADGCEALRLVSRAGLKPAVARLYDPADAFIAFRSDAPGDALLVLRFEGDALAEAEERSIRAVVTGAGGKDLGSALAERWWEHRNAAVQTLQKIMFEEALGPHAVVDTMEVAGRWPVAGLYEAVTAALKPHADVVGCHASHLYPQGLCLYFTFVFTGSATDDVAEERYRAAWEAAVPAALGAGATITHHHGVGLLRAPWLAAELGEGGLALLRAVKDALDPAGLMNPGKLGL